jgi:hypothetical protein
MVAYDKYVQESYWWLRATRILGIIYMIAESYACLRASVLYGNCMFYIAESYHKAKSLLYMEFIVKLVELSCLKFHFEAFGLCLYKRCQKLIYETEYILFTCFQWINCIAFTSLLFIISAPQSFTLGGIERSLLRKLDNFQNWSTLQNPKQLCVNTKLIFPNFKIGVFLMTYHIFQQRLQQCLSSFLI